MFVDLLRNFEVDETKSDSSPGKEVPNLTDNNGDNNNYS